jgi:hypothetical protein
MFLFLSRPWTILGANLIADTLGMIFLYLIGRKLKGGGDMNTRDIYDQGWLNYFGGLKQNFKLGP